MAAENHRVEVEWHPSGNFTLSVHEPGNQFRRDVILPCDDRAEFYKRTAQFLADLAAKGISFTYQDHPGRP